MYASNEQKPPAIFWARSLWVLASAALGLILDADFSAENILVRHHAYAQAPILGCYDTYTLQSWQWIMHRSLAVSVALKLYDRVHASAYVREGQETYYRISIDRSDQAPAGSHQPRFIHSFHYAVCSHVRSYICASVYATKLYIQPLNKNLLDLSSSPACMYPPINGRVGSSGTKKKYSSNPTQSSPYVTLWRTGRRTEIQQRLYVQLIGVLLLELIDQAVRSC